MTGYGKASRTLSNMKLSFEVRTLNSKQLDMNLKLPGFLSESEVSMRQLITRYMSRGKVSVSYSIEGLADAGTSVINQDLALKYYHELQVLADKTGDKNSDLLSIVMRMPDITRPQDETLPKEDLQIALDCMEEALVDCDGFREKEGLSLAEDLKLRVDTISGLLSSIEPLESARIDRVRNRIREELLRNFREEELDRNRFEQEMVYYLEKLDVTEEKVRLSGHCKHFLDVIDSESSSGKKLGFISQEMGREINTIGSKASDLDMQRFVVQMKDELEKIKEQVLNIL